MTVLARTRINLLDLDRTTTTAQIMRSQTNIDHKDMKINAIRNPLSHFAYIIQAANYQSISILHM
jgi:hypothetical protein